MKYRIIENQGDENPSEWPYLLQSQFTDGTWSKGLIFKSLEAAEAGAEKAIREERARKLPPKIIKEYEGDLCV